MANTEPINTKSQILATAAAKELSDFNAEVHDSVADVRKERDKFEAQCTVYADKVTELTKDNAWLKSDNALLEDADVLRNLGAGILSVCGGLTLLPETSLPVQVAAIVTLIPSEIWSLAYFVSIVAGIAIFCCGVWLRRKKRKTAKTKQT